MAKWWATGTTFFVRGFTVEVEAVDGDAARAAVKLHQYAMGEDVQEVCIEGLGRVEPLATCEPPPICASWEETRERPIAGPITEAVEKVVSHFARLAEETGSKQLGAAVADACRKLEKGLGGSALLAIGDVLPHATLAALPRIVLCRRFPAPTEGA